MSYALTNGPFDLNADNGPFITRVSIAMMCVSVVGICGRFLARRLMRQPLLWDDGMIVLALVFAWTCSLIQIIGVSSGNVGRHIQIATPETLVMFSKLLYSLNLVYPFAVSCVKLSVILFYRRIFAVPKTVKPLLLIAGVVVAWWIGVTFPGIFICAPIESFWEFDKPRECIDLLRYYLGVAIPNVLTDFILLALPVPWIWKLVMSRSQKFAITGIFLLGGFITIISTLRLIVLIQVQGKPDFTWNLASLAIWNDVELHVGILLACCPSMGPLLRLLLGKKLEGRASKPSRSWRLKSVEAHPAANGHTSPAEKRSLGLGRQSW